MEESDFDPDYSTCETEGCNPNLTNEIDSEQQQKIKGDAIGSTMYSERYVLKTLLSLMENNWNEEIESDLCALWDMTTEKDVVDFLLRNDFVKLSLTVIQKSDNLRLIEIMVGIIGNMCCYPETCNEVLSSEYDIYVSLFQVVDTPLLIQLMRLMKSLLFCNSDQSDLLINENILIQINFILSSSQNTELLLYTLQVLAEIIDKKKTQVLTEIDLLCNVNESFKQLFKNLNYDESVMFLNHDCEKILNAYLKVIQNIIISLSDEQDVVNYNKVYVFLQKNLENTSNYMNMILSLCCETELFHSIPQSIEFYISCCTQFILLLKPPFSLKILELFMIILNIVLTEKIKFNPEVITEIINVIIYEINKGEMQNIIELFKSWPKEKIIFLKDNIVNRNLCDDNFLCKFNKICSI